MIRFNEFTAEPEEMRRQELAAVERVIQSGEFILGPEVRQFEETWARYCGSRFCIGTANGMEALEIGLRSVGIGAGDEVITTPMTAIATVLAIMHARATPVLADIDPQTGLLDLASVERCLTPKSKAVSLVHLYGRTRGMDRWESFCKDANIFLLEDCAHAHGSSWNGRHAGTFGTWGAFSFYPTKNLAAKGDAGALITDSVAIYDRARCLRNCGATVRYEHREPGLNSRLDELQAAILSTRLKQLDQFNFRRQEIAQRYLSSIQNPLVELLPAPTDRQNHVYHLFVVRCSERDRLAHFLRENFIETLVHYPIPAHHQLCCQGIRCDPGGLPQAELHARRCLSLPCHPQMKDTDVEQVVDAINKFV